MSEQDLYRLLDDIQSKKLSIQEGVDVLKDLPFKDLGYARIDNQRELRVGYPEVIYAKGKTIDQFEGIFRYMATTGNNVLATRVTKAMYDRIYTDYPKAVYQPIGQTIRLIQKPVEMTESHIAIVAAGTSDMPVVEEASQTAQMYGNKVDVIVDVGVAGIHRLLAEIPRIKKAKVIIAVAGMEGALVSVLGGLVDRPIIAVPTSVGYGANLEGVTTMLAMLTSCASGVTVVNIDNGFGAAYSASMINHL